MNIEAILNEKVMKVWMKFIVASVVGVLLNALYTMVDGIFVGQVVGEAGLASINLAWPAVTLVLGIGSLLGTGASSLIAIHIGRENMKDAEKTLGTTLKAGIIAGGILSILGIVFANPMVKLLGATQDTFQYTKEYCVIIYLMAIPYILSTSLNPIVRADGNPKLSMLMVAAGAVGNIVLDWLFVMVFGWGIIGAALATGASIIISTVYGLKYFFSGKSYVKFNKLYFKINKPILNIITKNGFMAFAMQLSVGIVLLVQNNIIYMYGNTVDVAIYSVAGYIISLYIQVSLGIAQGMQPLIGYHYGADKTKRMGQILWITLSACFGIGVISYIILCIGGHSIISVFGLKGSTLQLAYQRIRLYCMGIPAIGILFTVGAYYQSIGKNIHANILSIGRGCVFQVIFSITLPYMIGVEGIFYSQPLSDFIGLILLGIVVIVDMKHNKKLC